MDKIGVMPRREVEVAIAIVFDADHHQLLICKRKAGTVLGGFWEFPGGKCDPGEAPRDCACREVLEETGLRVRILRPLAQIEHVYPHASVRLHPFVCELMGGELQLLEVDEARWIEPARVGDYQFPEANAALVRQIAAGFHALVQPAV